MSIVMKRVVLPRTYAGNLFTTVSKFAEGVNADRDIDRVINGEERQALASKIEIYLHHVDNGEVDIEHEIKPRAFTVTKKGTNVVLEASGEDYLRVTPLTHESLLELLDLQHKALKKRVHL